MSTPEIELHAHEIVDDLDQQVADRRSQAASRRDEARNLGMLARELDTEAETLESERDTVAARYRLALRYSSSSGTGGQPPGPVSAQEMRAIDDRHDIARLMAERDPLGEVRLLDACRQMHAAGVIKTDPGNAAKAMARAMKKNPIWEQVAPGRFRLVGLSKAPVAENSPANTDEGSREGAAKREDDSREIREPTTG